MLKIAFCDQEHHFISYLENKLLKVAAPDEDLEFWEIDGGRQAAKKRQRETTPDILFLNVQMPDTDSCALAMELRRKYPSALLILCSDLLFPDPQLLKARPYRYLTMQYPDHQIEKELEEVLAHLAHIKEYPSVWGCYEKTQYRLAPDDILYISKAKHGSIIHLFSGSFSFSIAREMSDRVHLQDLYARLCHYEFAYAHNSYIVNLKYVIKCSRTELQLADGHILTISRSKKKEFQEHFYQYHTDHILLIG